MSDIDKALMLHLAAAALLLVLGVYNVVDWRRKRMARLLSRKRPVTRGPDGRFRRGL
jgi:hypothetical protein